MQRFDQQVQELTPLDVQDKYIEIVINHHEGQSSAQEFKEKLSSLFRPYKVLHEQLPVFFAEISDEPDSQPAQSVDALPASTGQKDK